MSEVEIISEPNTTERDRGGRFVNGGKPGPGRPKGARSKLSEAFIEDLKTVWHERGIEALRRCATEDAPAFVRTVAMLMPKDINLNVAVDVADFATRFQTALAMLGNEPVRLRKPLPNQRVIEHDH